MAAIVASDIVTRYTVTAGSAGNTTASSAGGSLGKYASTSVWSGGALNDLFDDISGSENAASTVDYRCVAIYNTNASNSAQNVTAYISAEVAGGASIAIGVDPTAASAVGASSAQAVTIANETTAPAGVSFSSPTTYATGVAMGSIPVGQVRMLWIRRTATNSAALSADGVTLTIAVDTGSL